jgi:hypothetical protein
MEFRPCELPHVFSSADVGYVGRATDNVPPQGEGALPLYKLHDSQWAPCGVHGVEGTRTWSRPTGVFPRARSRDGGLDATVAYLRSMAWVRCKTVLAEYRPVLYVIRRSPCLRAADPNRDSNHDSNHNHNHDHNHSHSHNHARTCRVAPSQDASFPPWTRASRACTRCRLCCAKTCT